MLAQRREQRILDVPGMTEKAGASRLAQPLKSTRRLTQTRIGRAQTVGDVVVAVRAVEHEHLLDKCECLLPLTPRGKKLANNAPARCSACALPRSSTSIASADLASPP